MQNLPIKLSGVSFSYNKEEVLQDISLEVKKGEFLGIIGPNGSGKTTLLKILLGLLTPTRGTVSLFGQDLRNFKDWKKIGYVPQKAGSLNFRFPITVEEVVSFSSNSKESVKKALEEVGMWKNKKDLLLELSGGQQQRVFIAKALATNPELLILDEPTVGVDTESQVEFYELLKKLNKEKNLTIVLVSHDIDVVANEVSTVVCINKKIVSHGAPKDVLKGNFMEKLYGTNMKFVVHGH